MGIFEAMFSHVSCSWGLSVVPFIVIFERNTERLIHTGSGPSF